MFFAPPEALRQIVAERSGQLSDGTLFVKRVAAVAGDTVSVQSDGTIQWNCTADLVTVEALDKRYLPETCKDNEDEEEKDGEE